MVLTEFQQSLIARASAATLGYLVGLKIKLIKTHVNITPSTLVAELDAAQADFAGYALHVVTWLTPTISVDNVVEAIGTVPAWRPTDAVTPNVIWGFYAIDAVSGDLLFAGQFDTAPIPMDTAMREITVTIRYRPAGPSLVVYLP